MDLWFANTALILAMQAPFLLALGLHYDVLRRHNFALGGAYGLVLSLIVTLTPIAGLASAVGVGLVGAFVLLVVLEGGLFAPLARLSRSPDELLVASLGVNIVLEQGLSVAFGDRIRFPSTDADPLSRWLLEAQPHLVAVPLGAMAVLGVAFCLARTEIGARLIALGENVQLFRSLGFRPSPWIAVALGLCAALLGVSALASVNVTGAYPAAGFSLVILGFIVRLLGGPVRRPRFFVMLVAVVVADQAVAAVIPGQWRTVILFTALLWLTVVRTWRNRGAD